MGPGERALEARTDPRAVLGTQQLQPAQLPDASCAFLHPPFFFWFKILFVVGVLESSDKHEKIKQTHHSKPPGSPTTSASIPPICLLCSPYKEGGRA